MRVRFGDFVLDRGSRQLWRGPEERRLGPKAFDLLDLLLNQRPNVVPHERIRDRLWPGTFVSESTLRTVVGEVRAALDEDARQPQFLRTVHGVGFAFCGEATESGPRGSAARGRIVYRLVLDDREIVLRPGENLLGREEEGVVWLDSPSVSRRHACITVDEGEAVLEDLGSKNGTFLRGERLSRPVRLADGDVFRLGRVNIKLRAGRADQSTRTEEA
jgi:DNA-binding winged helix-turn-helix (wHTH) protein